MFERFTVSARNVVRGAAEYAERGDRATVGPEELLLALMDLTGTPGARALAELGVIERRASVESALERARRRGGVSEADAEALAGMGIDVEEIVARVERVHGVGALAAREPVRRRFFSHRPFTKEAKSVVERSLRVALGRGDKHIGDEHLLLALVTAPGPVAVALADHGATHADVVRVLDERGEKAG
ncbi:Clp protease N-terminal domain-containing protein [Streptomyces sp. NPDC003077]|uniref:Clp protease N-terminal domain-containing protein n=1 Tax=Streptomyces sp. NPDC003077 TaxID=3154443 RepID=UPI0033B743CF